MRRVLLLFHDTAWAALIAAILMAGFATPAFAYVDPSVMTYTIQALAGVAVALSAVAGVAFRRTRRALFKALNIDENARKDKDPAWVRTGEAGAAPVNHAGEKDFIAAAALKAPAAATASAAAKEAATGKAEAPLPWAKRFLIALLAVGFPAFTVGIAAPFEIVAGNLDA
ncbi:MAG: arylsulfatase, partial [Eggerthellaceae bacterium]|nr:arylsulfatase [Eggerthellaceae bacterium]